MALKESLFYAEPQHIRKRAYDLSGVLIWSAPAERSDDGALPVALAANLKRCRAPLATALQITNP